MGWRSVQGGESTGWNGVFPEWVTRGGCGWTNHRFSHPLRCCLAPYKSLLSACITAYHCVSLCSMGYQLTIHSILYHSLQPIYAFD